METSSSLRLSDRVNRLTHLASTESWKSTPLRVGAAGSRMPRGASLWSACSSWRPASLPAHSTARLLPLGQPGKDNSTTRRILAVPRVVCLLSAFFLTTRTHLSFARSSGSSAIGKLQICQRLVGNSRRATITFDVSMQPRAEAHHHGSPSHGGDEAGSVVFLPPKRQSLAPACAKSPRKPADLVTSPATAATGDVRR